MDRATYVYCLIADHAARRVRRSVKGLPGTGAVRLLAVPAGASESRRSLRKYLVVADAPLDRYGEAAINERLSDLDWVSRAAVAHESVVEAFAKSAAVLPMKLFTIFRSDDRALAHVAEGRKRIETVMKRVAGQEEWGVRVVLDPSRAGRSSTGERTDVPSRPARSSGASYLARKKAQRDAVTELATRSRQIVSELFERLNKQATFSTRRAVAELQAQGRPLLLDAAFLVPRRRARSFRANVQRQARALAPAGYGVTLTGPWPPYSFMQD